MSFIGNWIRKAVVGDIVVAVNHLREEQDAKRENADEALRKSVMALGDRMGLVLNTPAETRKAFETLGRDTKQEFEDLAGNFRHTLGRSLEEMQARVAKLEAGLAEAVTTAQGTLDRIRARTNEVTAAIDRRDREIGKTIGDSVGARLDGLSAQHDETVKLLSSTISRVTGILDTAREAKEESGRAAKQAATFSAKLDFLDNRLKAVEHVAQEAAGFAASMKGGDERAKLVATVLNELRAAGRKPAEARRS